MKKPQSIATLRLSVQLEPQMWPGLRDLNPNQARYQTSLSPDIQFYMVTNVDFTQKENQWQEKTIEKRFLVVVVKTVVKPGFIPVLRKIENGNMLVSQHILGLPDR